MRRGVVVSDLHCGSFYGLLPPGFVTFEGVPKILNAGQEYLWECWLDFVGRVELFKPDFVIVNGDVVDGLQFKSHGAELSLSNWKDQRDAAIKTLKVLRSVTRNKAKWYFTQGTPYHVGSFGEAEEDIAEAMGAVPYHSFGSGKLCREVLKLEIEKGFYLLAAHHVSLASVYTTTPLLKESRASNGEQLHIRSHGHHCTEVMEDGVRTVMSPCWQLQTRYARKPGPQRLQPDIGGLFIEISEGRSTVWPELYSVPSMPITKL